MPECTRAQHATALAGVFLLDAFLAAGTAAATSAAAAAEAFGVHPSRLLFLVLVLLVLGESINQRVFGAGHFQPFPPTLRLQLCIRQCPESE